MKPVRVAFGWLFGGENKTDRQDMGLFKSKYEKQLDEIIQRLEMNMSNNYKDNAQANLKELDETFAKMKADGLLKDKAVQKYEAVLTDYQSRMKGYTHKDQKPYWT